MSKTTLPPDMTVSSQKIHSTNQLKLIEQPWTALFQFSDSAFFLSWRWIASFAHLALENNYTLHLVKAIQHEDIVGLGIFAETTETRHTIFKYKQLYLHKTGNQALDKSWIEYNDLLLHHRAKDEIREAMWSFVTKQFSEIDEFALGVSEINICNKTADIMRNFLIRDYLHSTGYVLHLNQKNGVKYKSKQAHSQIKRSNQLLSEMGVKFTLSRRKEDYLAALIKMQPLHKKTWKDESGFNTETFPRHLNLLAQYKDTTALISAKLTIEDHVIAVLIGFVSNRTFYYYLSANENNNNNKIKFGLSLHHFVIEWCNEQGLAYYDFLAGDYRYKRSFTDNTRQFSYFYFQRPSMRARFEQWLRSIKKRLFSKE